MKCCRLSGVLSYPKGHDKIQTVLIRNYPGLIRYTVLNTIRTIKDFYEPRLTVQ
jgi:hypothetical protein